MGYSIDEISRPVRRRLKRIVQKSRDTRQVRRSHAILLLHEGYRISEVSRLLHAARSAIREWRIRFERFGEAGLVPEQAGRKPTRWITEMLARQLHTELGVAIHASTVRRLTPCTGRSIRD